jgi:DNA adenine methylase
MYRENSLGEFNVPFGRYKNPTILAEENIRAVAKCLKPAVLSHVAFEKAVTKAKRGDLVYFDPPYHPLSKTSSFTSYSEDSFSEIDQTRLRDSFLALSEKGCYVMLSNSFSPFIKKLYSQPGIYLHEVFAARFINVVAAKRGKIKEYLITNFGK